LVVCSRSPSTRANNEICDINSDIRGNNSNIVYNMIVDQHQCNEANWIIASWWHRYWLICLAIIFGNITNDKSAPNRLHSFRSNMERLNPRFSRKKHKLEET
ncbi:hypothetical protein RDWZM_000793, partial [Blomia tropicalis]